MLYPFLHQCCSPPRTAPAARRAGLRVPLTPVQRLVPILTPATYTAAVDTVHCSHIPPGHVPRFYTCLVALSRREENVQDFLPLPAMPVLSTVCLSLYLYLHGYGSPIYATRYHCHLSPRYLLHIACPITAQDCLQCLPPAFPPTGSPPTTTPTTTDADDATADRTWFAFKPLRPIDGSQTLRALNSAACYKDSPSAPLHYYVTLVHRPSPPRQATNLSSRSTYWFSTLANAVAGNLLRRTLPPRIPGSFLSPPRRAWTRSSLTPPRFRRISTPIPPPF